MRPTAPLQAVFTLCSPSLVGAGPKVLGLWTVLPTTPATAVAFATTAAPGPDDGPVWHVDLPTDPALAATALASGQAQVTAAQRALSCADARLQAFVTAQSTAPAFAVASAGPQLAGPEAGLWAWLRDLRGETISFGPGDWVRGGWEELTEPCQAFLTRLLEHLAHAAVVETAVQGHLLGRTTVSWTGNTDTVWRAGLAPASARLHQRALALALASRQIWMQMFVVIIRGALTLSVLLTTPGGAVLALPAAWQFVHHVLTESRQTP